MRRILVILLSLLLSCALFGQTNGKYSDVGFRVFELNLEALKQFEETFELDYHTNTSLPVPGVVIKCRFGADSLMCVTGEDGCAVLSLPLKTDVYVEASCIGYRTHRDTITTYRNLMLPICLEQDRQALEAAVIKENARLIQQIGDTLKYNVAAALKVGEDDMLSDVLERLPGFDLSGGLKVMNEDVKLIYVNGKLIFGNGVSDAMGYLAGNQVVNIKVYDELNPDKADRVRQGKEKQRVINIKTKEDFKQVVAAQASAVYGRNFDPSGRPSFDNRYAAGVSAVYFSEMKHVTTNVFLNNTGTRAATAKEIISQRQMPDGYHEVGYAGVAFMRKWKDPLMGPSLEMSYSYGRNKDENRREITREYSPSEEYGSRKYESVTDDGSQKRSHDVSLSYSSPDSFFRSVRVDGAVEDGSSSSLSDMGNAFNGTLERTVSDKHASLLDRSLRFETYLGKQFYVSDKEFDFHIRGYGNFAFSKEGSLQVNTNSGSETRYVNRDEGFSSNYDIHANLTRFFKDKRRTYASAAVSYSREHSNTRDFRYLNSVDEANLDRLSSDLNTYDQHKFRGTITMRTMEMNAFKYGADVAAEAVFQAEDRTLPLENSIAPHYFTLMPSFSLDWKSGMSSDIFLWYRCNPSYPSSQQINSHFNDLNPLYVTRGNPGLKKSMSHVLEFHYSRMAMSNVYLNVMAAYTFYLNSIISDTRFFSTQTSLDGYTFAPGSTYSTYVNADGQRDLTVQLDLRVPLQKLKFSSDIAAIARCSHTPSYVDGRLNYSNSCSPSVTMNMRSNFSTKYKINFKAQFAYSYVANELYDDVSYITQSYGVNSTNRFDCGLGAELSYNYTNRTPLLNASTAVNMHKLDAIVTMKIFKNRRGTIGLGCYDILNQNVSLKTAVVQNYFQTSFSPVFGRYWSVNFLFDFNSTKRTAGKGTTTTRGLGERYDTINGMKFIRL